MRSRPPHTAQASLAAREEYFTQRRKGRKDRKASGLQVEFFFAIFASFAPLREILLATLRCKAGFDDGESG